MGFWGGFFGVVVEGWMCETAVCREEEEEEEVGDVWVCLLRTWMTTVYHAGS